MTERLTGKVAVVTGAGSTGFPADPHPVASKAAATSALPAGAGQLVAGRHPADGA